MSVLALRGGDSLHPVFGEREDWAGDGGFRHRELAIKNGGVRVVCNCIASDFQDIRQGSWHKESNGRPVTVIMLEALLIFVDGVGLDVGNIPILCWRPGYFPGDYIPDVTIRLKTTEDDCVASEDCPPFPGAREDSDTILDTGLGLLMADVSNGRVMDPCSSPRVPASVEFGSVKTTCRYFIAIGAVDGVSIKPPGPGWAGREAITTPEEVGGRGSSNRRGIEMGSLRHGVVVQDKRSVRLKRVGWAVGLMQNHCWGQSWYWPSRRWEEGDRWDWVQLLPLGLGGGVGGG